jgi:hypothetical protein
MSRFYFLCLLLVLSNGRSADVASAATGELIDRVWSGHPVSFALLTEGGHQFIAYYDADPRLTVAGKKLGETAWTRLQPRDLPRDTARPPSELRLYELPDKATASAARVGS